jgi:phosphomannomutase
MVGDAVKDKDGISALAVLAEMANHLSAKNMLLSQYLDFIYQKYGHSFSYNSYVVCDQPVLIDSIFKGIRGVINLSNLWVRNIHSTFMD